MAPDEIRDTHPSDADWRADALAGSRHSRLADHLVEPIESHDVEQSAVICARVSRTVLGDLAPALILLHPEWRQRVQALTAYGLTLFDFAKQTGLEGERLSQINRWEFELETALSGEPLGQPVFVLLAAENRIRPWPVEALDRLGNAARRRITSRRPSTATALDQQALELGGAIVASLVEDGGTPAIDSFAAALLRIRGLQDLAHRLRRHQAPLPVNELADSWDPGSKADGRQLDLAIGGECRRIRALLAEAPQAVSTAPPPMRAAATYLLLAGHRLLAEIEERGVGILERPPQLGLVSRVGLLLRARWG
ncbi:MAG: squalene/phytoene synthase family protein [Thermoanaerobaculia bacterium]